MLKETDDHKDLSTSSEIEGKLDKEKMKCQATRKGQEAGYSRGTLDSHVCVA